MNNMEEMFARMNRCKELMEPDSPSPKKQSPPRKNSLSGLRQHMDAMNRNPDKFRSPPKRASPKQCSKKQTGAQNKNIAMWIPYNNPRVIASPKPSKCSGCRHAGLRNYMDQMNQNPEAFRSPKTAKPQQRSPQNRQISDMQRYFDEMNKNKNLRVSPEPPPQAESRGHSGLRRDMGGFKPSNRQGLPSMPQNRQHVGIQRYMGENNQKPTTAQKSPTPNKQVAVMQEYFDKLNQNKNLCMSPEKNPAPPPAPTYGGLQALMDQMNQNPDAYRSPKAATPQEPSTPQPQNKVNTMLDAFVDIINIGLEATLSALPQQNQSSTLNTSTSQDQDDLCTTTLNTTYEDQFRPPYTSTPQASQEELPTLNSGTSKQDQSCTLPTATFQEPSNKNDGIGALEYQMNNMMENPEQYRIPEDSIPEPSPPPLNSIEKLALMLNRLQENAHLFNASVANRSSASSTQPSMTPGSLSPRNDSMYESQRNQSIMETSQSTPKYIPNTIMRPRKLDFSNVSQDTPPWHGTRPSFKRRNRAGRKLNLDSTNQDCYQDVQTPVTVRSRAKLRKGSNAGRRRSDFNNRTFFETTKDASGAQDQEECPMEPASMTDRTFDTITDDFQYAITSTPKAQPNNDSDFIEDEAYAFRKRMNLANRSLLNIQHDLLNMQQESGKYSKVCKEADSIERRHLITEHLPSSAEIRTNLEFIPEFPKYEFFNLV